jgi:hypothetical protein
MGYYLFDEVNKVLGIITAGIERIGPSRSRSFLDKSRMLISNSYQGHQAVTPPFKKREGIAITKMKVKEDAVRKP